MRLAIILTCAAVAILPLAAAKAESFSTIYKFDSATGKNPSGNLVQDRNGALYGVVHFFGQGGSGAVFQLAPPSPGDTKWVENILYNFTGGDDGASPVGGLVRSKSGTLFGTTIVGGHDNAGTVFMLTPSGTQWTKTVIYNFPSSDGFSSGGLFMDETGSLYGCTQTSVFQLTPPGSGEDGWTETTLHVFSAEGDGRGPTCSVTGDSAAIYGTTRSGGANDMGIAYRLTPRSSGEGPWDETVLHTFSGADGSSPNGDLILKGHILYGTTAYGGTSDFGTVYALKAPSGKHDKWRQTVIYNFSGADGHLPYNGLTKGSDGSLYGTTVEGGTIGKHGYGVVFRLTPSATGEKTWTQTVLHSFDNKDGNSPGVVLLDKSGAIYGNAQYGARDNTGTAFEILP